MSKSNVSIEELPRYSPWPARLLGIEPWKKRRKTRKEVIREYDDEKWSSLLREARRLGDGVTLEKIKGFERGGARECCWDDGRLKLLTPENSMRRQMAIFRECLESYLPASALVELGCGYGAILLELARLKRMRGLPVFGGEYTDNGCELTRLLGKQLQVDLTVGKCDFGSRVLTQLPIPPGALIYTSYAVPYVRQLKRQFVDGFLRLKPKVVVHFEPCLEHCKDDDLLHLLVRRYIELNDYNRNLLTVLKEAEKSGDITLVEERPIVFANTPFLPISVVAWKPATR